MAKNSEFYKGRVVKQRNYAIIPAAIILGIIAVAVVLFYGIQRYAVITKESVSVKLPGLEDSSAVTVDAAGRVVKVFDPVDCSLVIDPPDYSNVKAVAGSDLDPLRAIFVPAENITRTKLEEYVSRLVRADTLVLEMKPRSGKILWNSSSAAALDYGLYEASEQSIAIPDLIKWLKEQNVRLVAQISCCVDEIYAARCSSVALKTPYGAPYSDDTGTWLDPYNVDVRNYVIQMVRELYDMGFDEVVLADVAHPVLEEDVQVAYTRDMSSDPGPVNAVCGFAMTVADELRDRSGILSIYCNSGYALVRADSSNGQDCPFFFKLYDRVYYPTDMGTYSFNLTDVTGTFTIGTPETRFVPVVENYLPACDIWVLVDVPEEEE